MARQRRTGGFRAPELKGTLGTLLRTTLQQASAVRDVIERGARSRLDDMRHNRRRQDALAELGEIVLELVQRGEIDLDELPEARAIVEQLLDDDHGAHDDHRHHEREREPEFATPPSRSRFDDRRAKDDGTVAASSGRWSPPRQPAAPAPAAPGRVWRPEVVMPSVPSFPPAKAASPTPRKGGISFEGDDDDLAEYMHPDDVPPKDGDS